MLKNVLKNLLCVITCGMFPLFGRRMTISALMKTSTSILTVITTATCHRPGCQMRLFLFNTVHLGCLTLIIVKVSMLSVASDGTKKRVTRLNNTLTKL